MAKRSFYALLGAAFVALGIGAASAETGVTADEIRNWDADQQPEGLIGALLFLVSTDSDFITNQTLLVDGRSAMQ